MKDRCSKTMVEVGKAAKASGPKGEGGLMDPGTVDGDPHGERGRGKSHDPLL